MPGCSSLTPIALSAESDTRLKTGRGASPVGCGSSSVRALGHWSGRISGGEFPPKWSAAQCRGPRDLGVAPRVRHHLELDRALPPDVEHSCGLVDLGKRWQTCLVAEVLYRIGRCSASELEVLLPGDALIDQIGIHIGAVEDVAGAVGVDDLLIRDIQRRQEALSLALVVPEHTARAHGDGPDLAAARAQISQHLARRQLHLLA